MMLARIICTGLMLLACAAGAEPKGSPAQDARKFAWEEITLANIIGLDDEHLAQVDIAAMWLLAGQGMKVGDKTIDLERGMNCIERIAYVYGEYYGLDSEDGGGQTDRGKIVALIRWLKETPPSEPLPLAVVVVSVGRKLGMPIHLARTFKGDMVCMASPECNTFIDVHEDDARFFTIEGEDQPRTPPNVEQPGRKVSNGESLPEGHHWIYSPREELAAALASRGDLLRGTLSLLRDGTLGIETESGLEWMKPEAWQELNKPALMAYLQAQLCTDKLDYRVQIEQTSRVVARGYTGMFGGGRWLKMPDADKPAIRNMPYEKLLEMTLEQLDRQDVGEVNLAVADGLPGAGRLDVLSALDTMDDWARLVNFQIKRNRALWEKTPGQFGFSESRYKAYILCMALQEDVGIKYNPEIAEQYDEKTLEEKYPDIPYGPYLLAHAMSESKSQENANHKFISGFFGEGGKLGTCTSMAAIYAAVGRRLRMPIKLVRTAGHVFNRWDDGKEVFNFDGANGFAIRPDDYYKTWPLRVLPQDIEPNGYFKSLTGAEELAMFLRERALVLDRNGHEMEAMLASIQATLLEDKIKAAASTAAATVANSDHKNPPINP